MEPPADTASESLLILLTFMILPTTPLREIVSKKAVREREGLATYTGCGGSVRPVPKLGIFSGSGNVVGFVGFVLYDICVLETERSRFIVSFHFSSGMVAPPYADMLARHSLVSHASED